MQCNFNIGSKAWRPERSSKLSSVWRNIKSFGLFSGTAQKDLSAIIQYLRSISLCVM